MGLNKDNSLRRKSRKKNQESHWFKLKIQYTLENNKCSTTIVMGDWNWKTGKSEIERVVRQFWIGERNERGIDS